MACACKAGQKQVFKVIQASGTKVFDTYPKAKEEQNKNGGSIRVTYATK